MELGLEGKIAEKDWKEYRRLCDPESPDTILNSPDYYAFLTYTLFRGEVPRGVDMGRRADPAVLAGQVAAPNKVPNHHGTAGLLRRRQWTIAANGAQVSADAEHGNFSFSRHRRQSGNCDANPIQFKFASPSSSEFVC